MQGGYWVAAVLRTFCCHRAPLERFELLTRRDFFNLDVREQPVVLPRVPVTWPTRWRLEA